MKNRSLFIVPFIFLVACSNGVNGSSVEEKESSTPEDSSAYSSENEYTLQIKTVHQYLSYAPTKIEVYKNGEPSDIELYFEIVDESVCMIENGYVKGLKVGESLVYASSLEGVETTFSVFISDFNDYPFNRDVQSKEEAYKLHGNYENPTLFVGDSFFDTANFWKTFYDDFPSSKQCVSVGISSTKTTDWVICRDRLLLNYKPKNLILHIGTNDINDTAICMSVSDYYKQIAAFLELCVNELPSTKIYYFGIENRAGSAGAKNTYAEKVTAMIQNDFAPKHSNFTYIDSPKVFNANQEKYISGDNIHPSRDGYRYYVDILNELVNFRG